MALAIDAKTTASANTASAQVLDNTTLTVGAGATSLLAVLIFNGVNVLPTANSMAVHWDSTGTNQLMTLVSGTDYGSANFNGLIQVYGLVNPTAGNKTLHASWTTACPVVLDAISFSGGVATSVATAFVRTGSNQATSGSPTVSLTGASGNISACVYDACGVSDTATSLTATGSSNWFSDSAQSRLKTFGATAPSASTVTWTGAPASAEWVMVGVDVVSGGSTQTGTAAPAGAGSAVGAAVQRMVAMTWALD